MSRDGGRYQNTKMKTSNETFMSDAVEILLPPFVILGVLYAALFVLWLKSHGYSIIKTFLPANRRSSVVAHDPSLYKDSPYGEKTSVKPLLTNEDNQVIRSIREETNTFKELVKIVVPATISLGFCPISLFSHALIVQGLWPPRIFATAPNINDGVACFLVPAGMVYAVSFGFAFQAVFTRNQDVGRCINEEVSRFNRVISLLSRIKVSNERARLVMFSKVKDEVMLLVQDLLGTRDPPSYDLKREAFQDMMQDLEAEETQYKTSDTVLRKQVIKLISSQVYRFGLSCPHEQRLHPAMWAFLECLGYFNFMAMLLVQSQSYVMALIMCIITVVSISMLCYIVADLDSPFHGFFRSDFADILSLVNRLDVIYNNCARNIERNAIIKS